MRFYSTEDGATRINGGFCILPVIIGGETRWLEWAEWVEVYDDGDWVPVRWQA